MKSKKIEQPKQQEFIIVNEISQVFCGLKAGSPNFTEDWSLAKPLVNEEQFKCVQRGTVYNLEKLFI